MAKKKKKNKNAAFAAGIIALILALIGAFRSCASPSIQ